MSNASLAAAPGSTPPRPLFAAVEALGDDPSRRQANGHFLFGVAFVLGFDEVSARCGGVLRSEEFGLLLLRAQFAEQSEALQQKLTAVIDDRRLQSQFGLRVAPSE